MQITRRLTSAIAATALTSTLALSAATIAPAATPSTSETTTTVASLNSWPLPDAVTTKTSGSTTTRTEVYFSSGSPAAPDWRIVNHYARLVNSVPKGSTIRTTIHNTSASSTFAPFIAFQNALNKYDTKAERSEKISVMANAEKVSKTEGLGEMLARHKTMKWCGTGEEGELNSSCSTGGNDSLTMHTKFALFGKAKDSTGRLQDWVVWISTANLNRTSGAEMANSSVTIYGDEELFKGLANNVWKPMYNKKAADLKVTVADASSATVYPSPTSTDDILSALKSYDLADTSKMKGCTIRVDQVVITRTTIADQLVTLKKHGCDVRIRLGQKDELTSNVAKMFSDAKIPVKDSTSHEKTIIVKARTSTSGDFRYFTFTGSQNLTPRGLKNDELVIRLIGKPVHDAFAARFDSNWS